MMSNDPSQATGQLTVASAATSITLFGLSVSEVAVIVSAVVAVASFALHVWYTLEKNRREEAESQHRMQQGDDSPSDGLE